MATSPSRQARHNEWSRAARQDPAKVPNHILIDTRSCDKKAGRKNDLDLVFIREAIREGCSYCGETTLRMTLDRIDNTLGHLKSNVVSACIRCNYARRNMPHAAWLMLAPAMRAARLAGLFGEWTGQVNSSRGVALSGSGE